MITQSSNVLTSCVPVCHFNVGVKFLFIFNGCSIFYFFFLKFRTGWFKFFVSLFIFNKLFAAVKKK